MLKILLSLHKSFYTTKEQRGNKRTNPLVWIFCEGGRRVTQVLFNWNLVLRRFLGRYPQPLQGNGEVIVSLTSFPARIKNVWGAIDSMFHQTIPPSRIYLYLTEEEFPNGKSDLPQRLLQYEPLGLEICFRPYNLMPHTKYFYALQEHKDKCVITIDDDVYYHEDLIAHLLQIHKEYPGTICANRSRCIELQKNGQAKSYAEWPMKQPVQENVSHRNLALGTYGVLYPPHNYAKSGMFDAEKIHLLCLRADDLWLKIHEIMGGGKGCNYGLLLSWNFAFNPGQCAIVEQQCERRRK